MFRRKKRATPFSGGGGEKLTNERAPEEPSPIKNLTGAELAVRKVIYLPQYKVVAAACWDEKVRVYDVDTPGEPRTTFSGHINGVQGLCYVHKDVVASVGDDGRLYTWHAMSASAEQEGFLQVDNFEELTSVATLSNSRIVVGISTGDLVVVTHKRGALLKKSSRIEEKHTKGITEIVDDSIWMVTCSKDRTAIVWDISSLQIAAVLKHDSAVRSASISSRRIVTVGSNGNIHIYKNKKGFPLYKTLLTGASTMHSVSILSDNVISVMGDHGLVSFVSISNKKYFAHSQVECDSLYSQAQLTDGRMVIGGSDGFCAIFPRPQQVDEEIEDERTLKPTPTGSDVSEQSSDNASSSRR